MSIVATPCLAMLLVLANIALCLTAEWQKRGSLKPPTEVRSFAALPLGRADRKDRTTLPTGLAARRQ